MSNVLLTYVWRVCNVYRLIRYSYASHTQSTLAIRWSHAGHTLVIRWHLLTFAGHTLAIRWRYATHTLLIRFNTVSIRTILHFQGLFVRMKIILWIVIRNSYVSLIRNGVTGPLSWNRTFSVWWRYYGNMISDRLCFICLIWHTRGDKPVLPWLSRKNSDLLVRKTTLDTVERWLRMLGPGRHVTVRLRTTDPAVYLQLRS